MDNGGVRQNLGPVSAYALAVKHGYIGTEEEWAQNQAQVGTYANEAKAAFEASKQSADQAEQHKQTAEAKAKEAAGSASDAKAKAREAAESATNASKAESTAVTKALEVIESAESAAESASTAESYSQKAADSAELSAGAVKNHDTSKVAHIHMRKTIVDQLTMEFNENAAMVQEHLVEGYPMHLTSNIRLVQEGEGDPSPTNVRPIKGFDKAKITVCSVNLAKKFTSKTNNGVSFTVNEDGSVLANNTGESRDKGASITIALNINLGERTLFLSGGVSSQFVLEATALQGGATKYFTDTGNGVLIKGGGILQNVRCIVRANASADNVLYKPMLTIGTSSVPYKPYSGEDFTATFSETVYGGTYDWTSGVLTKTWKANTFTSVSEFSMESTGTPGSNRFSAALPNSKKSDTGADVAYCTSLKLGVSGATYNGSGVFTIAGGKLYIRPADGMQSIDDLTQYLPLTVAYQLNTPETVQLTAETILSQHGITTIYSDTGDTAVVARKDPVYVNKEFQGNAKELTDIRVGSDGVTYPSAGKAVRSQISKLSGEIAYLNTSIEYVKGEEVTSSSYDTLEQSYITGKGTIATADGTSFALAKIAVQPYDKFIVAGLKRSYARLWAVQTIDGKTLGYAPDEDKGYVVSEDVVTIPENGRYLLAAILSENLRGSLYKAKPVPKLADGSVTSVKLAEKSVTSEKLADKVITSEKLANGSVTVEKLGDKAVTTAKLSEGSVTTEKLVEGSVTAAKLGEKSVTSEKLADGAVTYDKVGQKDKYTYLKNNSNLEGYLFGSAESQKRTYEDQSDEFSMTVLSNTTANNGASYVIDQTLVDYSGMLYVEFDLVNASRDLTLLFSIVTNEGTTKYENAKSLPATSETVHYLIQRDLAHDAVYNDMASLNNIAIRFNSNQVGDTFTICNFRVYHNYYEGCTYFNPKLNQYLSALDKAVQKAGESSESGNAGEVVFESIVATSPSGKRFVMSISDAGVITPVPIVPDNILFIGNSLLFGFGTFGMAAQDNKHDYYHYVTTYLTDTLGVSLTAQKLSSSPWETQTDKQSAMSWVASNVLPKLSNDTQLVLIQLSDNVNTPEKIACFKESCYEMTSYIRGKAPNARVAWVSAWYYTTERQNIIKDACEKTGSIFIDISDLCKTENKNKVGNTYINSRGEVTEITSVGIASHPNSRGMLAIANRILYKLGITETEETITDDTLDM